MRSPLRSFVRSAPRGFSLVELVVALFFTAILMAGLARVFKNQITNAVAVSEGMSNSRRNRTAADALVDELNNAGMFLIDIAEVPLLGSKPAFSITAGDRADSDPSKRADRVEFYLDEALPIDATLVAGGGYAQDGIVMGAGLTAGASANASAAKTYTLDLKEPDLVGKVESGMFVVSRSGFRKMKIMGTPGVNGSKVQFTADPNMIDATTGAAAGHTGGINMAEDTMPQDGDVYYLVKRRRMIRFSIEKRSLDPSSAELTPCLIREIGDYPITSTTFTPDPGGSTVVAENVEDIQFFVSANGGQNWGKTVAQLKTHQGVGGNSNLESKLDSPFWFRELPIMVRIDLVTRNFQKRDQFSKTAGSADYNRKSQTIIMTPRHFGLPYAVK